MVSPRLVGSILSACRLTVLTPEKSISSSSSSSSSAAFFPASDFTFPFPFPTAEEGGEADLLTPETTFMSAKPGLD
jgi:hypothetical protein